MNKVVFDTSADQDVASILRYLLEETQSPQSAEALIDLIYSKANRLKEFPKLYPIYNNASDLKYTYRFFPVLSYLVFYYIDHGLVHISRIIHTKRNIIEYLK